MRFAGKVATGAVALEARLDEIREPRLRTLLTGLPFGFEAFCPVRPGGQQ